MENLSLAEVDVICASLAQATTIQEVKQTIDAASAFQVWLKKASKEKEANLRIAEHIIRSERKLGWMLKEAKTVGQITKTNTLHRDHVPDENMISFTLKEVGITRKLSMRAQQIAEILPDEFERVIGEGRKIGKLSRNLFTKKSVAAKKEISSNGAAPEIEVKTEELLPKEQKKVESVIQQYKKSLEDQLKVQVQNIEAEISRRVKEILSDSIGPHYKKEQELARRLITARKGIMTRKQYNKIRACLHTDREASPDEKNQAFILFTSFEKYLLKEADSPTEFVNIPSTSAEWDAVKNQTTEARKQKNKSKMGTVKVR